MSGKHDVKQGKNKGKQHRWKAGESGNPRGRPRKEECFTDLLKEELEEIEDLKDKNGNLIGRTNWWRLLVKATLRLAVKGNSTALKEVWDRIDGKQSQPIDLNVRKIEHVLAELPPPRPRKDFGIEGRPGLLHRELPSGKVEGGIGRLPSANGSTKGNGGLS